MKTLPPNDVTALLALAGLGIGVMLLVGSFFGLAAGMGAALVAVCTLVLIYLVLPDRSAP